MSYLISLINSWIPESIQRNSIIDCGLVDILEMPLTHFLVIMVPNFQLLITLTIVHLNVVLVSKLMEVVGGFTGIQIQYSNGKLVIHIFTLGLENLMKKCKILFVEIYNFYSDFENQYFEKIKS